MPIQIKLATFHFKDESGTEVPDATFTIRTRLSHDGQIAYMKAIAESKLDFSALVAKDGSLDRDAIAEVSKEVTRVLPIDAIKQLQTLLIEDALMGLTGVLDENGNPMGKALFSRHDEFYVTQVVQKIQEVSTVRQSPDPNASAPSVVR